ncbi:MAG: hypothetical protein ACF8Q5_07785 [Phycisphaerales bacterium JB040]
MSELTREKPSRESAEVVDPEEFDNVAPPRHDEHEVTPSPTHASSSKPLTWSLGIYVGALILIIIGAMAFGGWLT